MSRAIKRAMARAERNKPNRSAAIYVTNFQLEHESFDSIERLFQEMRHGALRYDEADRSWVIMGLDGSDLHVLSALEGWVTYWKELTDQQAVPYDDSALRRLAKSLEYHKPMLPEEVEAAYAVVIEQRRIYRALPKSVTTQVSHEVRKSIQRTDEIRELLGVAP